MNFAIRPTPPDHPRVVPLFAELDALLQRLYEPEHRFILDVDALKGPAVTFLAAWQGDDAIGCGAVRVMAGEPATDGERYGEIKRMFVARTHRGQGIGAQILASLEASLRDQGIDRALLETGAELADAVHLYRIARYEIRGEFGDYRHNGVSLFMEKRWKTARAD